jgi:hypothetical protein
VRARLLLDEMFDPRIAAALSEHGHDCVAVAAEARLSESSDDELIDGDTAGRAQV